MGKHLPTDLKALARAHTDSALKVLVGVMTCETAPESSRVAAANSLLDRGWGKAVQAVELSGEVSSKVIRAPAASPTPSSWAETHVPIQHRTEH